VAAEHNEILSLGIPSPAPRFKPETYRQQTSIYPPCREVCFDDDDVDEDEKGFV